MKPWSLAIALVVACAPEYSTSPLDYETDESDLIPQIWNIRVDPSLTDINAPLAAWEKATRHDCPIKFVITVDWVGLDTPPGETNITIRVGDLPPGYAGITGWGLQGSGYGANIVVLPFGSYEPYESLIKHELGHALKLPHFDGGIMQQYGGPEGITKIDVDEFCKK